jgi:hypothetical protein
MKDEKQKREVILRLYAFRYALGKQGYEVQNIASVLYDEIKNMTKEDLGTYIQEIQEAIDNNKAGSSIELFLWCELLEKMKEAKQDLDNELINDDYRKLYEKFCKVLDYATGSRCSKPEARLGYIKNCIDAHTETTV